MTLHLWTGDDLDNLLVGQATVLRSTYFGELVLTPDRNSVERLGSLEVRGHWTIVHTWDTGGPTMQVELVAFKYGRISQDPNQRSSGLIRRLPFTTKLLVRGVQGEIELTKR